MTAQPLGAADLHLHTLASDGLQSWRALLDHAEHRTDLDVIAVTDHDEVAAALAAREHAARHNYRVHVVPGVEVTTRQGHLVALFVEERPPALRPFVETAEWVRQRGGLVVAAHPFARCTPSAGDATLRRALELGLLDAVETLNPSPAGRLSHARARAFAATEPVAAIGASDAHWSRIVGLARTRFAGRTPEDLRQAIQARETVAEGRFARLAEVAVEALPQLAWANVALPLLRLARLLPPRQQQPLPDLQPARSAL